MQPEREAEARLVYAAIAELPEDFRFALVAVDVTGLSYEEAAKALRIPEGTVRSRLYRARDRIADLLGDQLTESEPQVSEGGRSV
jgi:RNA polymerase sigma-70 factor (ECF subfamily)